MPDRSSQRWRELKESVPILQVLVAANASSKLRRSGQRLVGPCPVHLGDNPRAFVVDDATGRWYCFTGCQRGGDALTLAWLFCDRSWPKTADWLEQLAARPLPVPTSLTASSNLDSPHTSRRRPFCPFTRRLRLDPEHPFLARMHLNKSTIQAFEAGAWHGPGYLVGTIAVRLHDLEGHPIGYAGRLLDPERVRTEGKWRWPPGYPKSSLLFNWHRAHTHLAAGIIVVEGVWSTIKLTQAGYPNVIALGGTVVSHTQAPLLARAPRVILMLDGDTAGEQATQRLMRQGIHPYQAVIRPPPAKDPADLDEVTLGRLLKAARLQPVSPNR